MHTFIHEMGHALGYCSHPLESGNIMFEPGNRTKLTSAEKNHLKEIYDNFS